MTLRTTEDSEIWKKRH